jgi:hypothetical protein
LPKILSISSLINIYKPLRKPIKIITIPITILSPKTGDTWAQGYKQTVSWSSKPISQSNTIIYSLEDGPTPGDFLSYETNSIDWWWDTKENELR